MILNWFDDQPFRVAEKLATTYAFLFAANAVAWIWALTAFSGRPALLGTAFLAYMFGLRHAFDADHIAAIDNVVRKLMQEGKAPHSVGLFFSLGHSTIVVLASIAIATAAAAIDGTLDAFRDVGGAVGTVVSAMFLLGIGIANLFILKGIWSAFERVRRGEQIVGDDLNALFAGRGFLARIFGPLFGLVCRSWHMYPIGILFGLGFDTATEIGLLGISATQAARGMSFWTILLFPALFTAAMSLMDTTDSVLMTRAYGWAFVNPMRKLWYNLTITAASVSVAIFIGGMEALELIGGKLGFEGGFWELMGDMNGSLANFGFVVVGIFAGSWLISSFIYRLKGYDRPQAGQP